MEYTDEKFVIWFAGFYEGEGTVANDKSNRNSLKVGVYQNDPVPLYIAQKRWGGQIRRRERKSPASDKICVCHEWSLKGSSFVTKFFEDIRKYMIIPYKINQLKKCEEKLLEPWTQRFKCKFCDKDYSDPQGRRRHEKKDHASSSSVRYKCDFCDKDYSDKSCKKRHEKDKHPELYANKYKTNASISPSEECETTKLRESPKVQDTTQHLETNVDTRGNDLENSNNS